MLEYSFLTQWRGGHICKMPLMAKFKCAPVDIGTTFQKVNHEVNEYFKTENVCLYLL